MTVFTVLLLFIWTHYCMSELTFFIDVMINVVSEVYFGYHHQPELFVNVEFGLDLSSRSKSK